MRADAAIRHFLLKGLFASCIANILSLLVIIYVFSSRCNMDVGNTDSALYGLAYPASLLVTTLVGLGSLSMPYAFRMCGGTRQGTLVLAVVVLTSWWTACRLGETLRLLQSATRGPQSFLSLSRLLCSSREERVIRGICVCEIFLAITTLLIIAGHLVPVICAEQPISRSNSIIATAVISALLALSPARLYFSAASCSSLLLVPASAVLLWTSGQKTIDAPPTPVAPHLVTPAGVMLFCVAAHPCFPRIYHTLPRKETWNACCSAAFAFAFFYYACMGVVGLNQYDQRVPVVVSDYIDTTNAHTRRAVILAVSVYLVKLISTAPLLILTLCDLLGERAEGATGVLAALLSAAFLAIVAEDNLVSLTASTGVALSSLSVYVIPLRLHVLARRVSREGSLFLPSDVLGMLQPEERALP